MLEHPKTHWLLLNESMLDPSEFDIERWDYRDELCCDPEFLSEFASEIEYQLNSAILDDHFGHVSVLGFSSEWRDVTHFRARETARPHLLQPGPDWEKSLVRVARHFGGPDDRPDKVIVKQFEQQKQEYHDALAAMTQERRLLRNGRNPKELALLRARRNAVRAPMLRGFRRPEELTMEPIEQAIDLRPQDFDFYGHLLLEVRLFF